MDKTGAKKYQIIFEYLKQNPILSSLWCIGAEEEEGQNVVLPQGTSQAMGFENEMVDVNGIYSGTHAPMARVYEDFQINCFRYVDINNNQEPSVNLNVRTLEEVQSICEWIEKQNEVGNFPKLNEAVIAIECNPFNPQIRYVDLSEKIIAYFITVRVHYLNPRKPRYFEHEFET